MVADLSLQALRTFQKINNTNFTDFSVFYLNCFDFITWRFWIIIDNVQSRVGQIYV